MKKIISALVAILCLFSLAIAESDITFQGIPWLSDETVTAQTLIEKGFIQNNVNGLPIANNDSVYLIEDGTGNIIPSKVSGAEDVTFIADLSNVVKGKIAGYPVKDLSLTYGYDGEYKLIAVKVELVKGDYNDIKSKLGRVYGDGEQNTTEEGIESIVWKGEDNSAILLVTYSEGLDYTLIYGRLDAEEILSKCLEVDPDDVSGL